MLLAAKLAFQFDRKLQVAGNELSRAESVRVTVADPDRLHAEVRDGRPFKVELQFEAGRLRVACGCQNFTATGRCKHLWACVLAADREGALRAALNERYLRVVYDSRKPVERPTPVWQMPVPRYTPPPQLPAWREHLNAVRKALTDRPAHAPKSSRPFELLYVIDVGGSNSARTLVVEVVSRTQRKDGQWTEYTPFRTNALQAGDLPDAVDAEVVPAIIGGQEHYGFSYGGQAGTFLHKALPPALALKLIPKIAATGRLAYHLPSERATVHQMAWADGDPWKLWLELRQDDRDQWKITGVLKRGEERMPLEKPVLILESGFLIADHTLARFDAGPDFPWVGQLRTAKNIPFPDRERDAVLANLLECPNLPPMDVDEPLRFEHRRVQARLGLRITPTRAGYSEKYFHAELLMDYGSGWTADVTRGAGFWQSAERVYLERDTAFEEQARQTLRELRLKPEGGLGGEWKLPVKSMPRIVRELLHAGWHVEVEGKAFRRPGEARVDVRSGIDWFELHAEVDYGDATASLPHLLAAMRRGDTMVPLSDGSFGLLPDEWLDRFAPLAGLGSKEGDHLRFKSNQAGLLDALLAAQPAVQVDRKFEEARERLRSFHGVEAAPQPEGFTGTLREYQREGLGWMAFLREFGFGGCLADDMGVGKTAQVLAALEVRRAEGKGPSLVVAPKSLMFNWRAEAARFTPKLRVLEHTGLDRDMAAIADCDLVLTTYGTLLRDAPLMAETEFDYVVLDEAQAIKNAATASAKAVRLLRGAHRLALSGTPVQNHLGELWSLFEFLNPGMLGEAKVLKLSGGLERNPSEDARRLLARALRPFILRRTKQQVASELPTKTEQTILCELEPAQRRQYDELRQHYRESLLGRVARDGLGKSKMHVLEALLRLRQAACHPGLLDARLASEPSAKLDVLMSNLEDLREEGHKALVFSQFTSLLAIVRDRLDAAGVRYEYLDGSTQNREAHVEAFQNDPDCGLFLISLKAGGLGLNLTAAEYVFLLDPWWNPAVEAQAVDRAHRIGQTKPVFAYRLIARDTVEEKVLELQETKRELADAILGEDNSLVRNLTTDDLELLLS